MPQQPGPSAPYIAVVGPSEASPSEESTAEEVGALLAERGAVVVCGGLGGVMAAAARGVAARSGTVVGVLPGRDRTAGNPHLSVAIATGMGEMRNALLVAMSDALIAVGGSWGTLSEVALARRTGKPVAALGGWDLPGLLRAATPEEAVGLVLPR